MLDLRLAVAVPRRADVVALAVAPDAAGDDGAPDEAVADAGLADESVVGGSVVDGAGADDAPGSSTTASVRTPPGIDPAEVAAFLDAVEHTGKAGSVHTWVRPLQAVGRVLFVGVGARDEAAWRSAGAAVVRKATSRAALAVLLPADCAPAELRGFAEGMWLGSYRYRLRSADDKPTLRRVTLVAAGSGDGGLDGSGLAEALHAARVTAEMTVLARDLTNTPADRKSPGWLARQVARRAAGVPGLSATVRGPAQLVAEGFGGVLAVGAGSANPPQFVELSWRPRGARTHVVLVGKGITFDTGGVCVKTREQMKLMRKDMGGAAAVAAATVGAAALGLPVRVTALLPLAENMLSGTAMRPGDVVRHYDGTTTEVRNTDAEGRLVLADALGYAVRRLRPDLLIDLATLTGAQSVALGKRTAALFSVDDALAAALVAAAAEAGEKLWRLPLADDYVDALHGDDTDLINSTEVGGGAVMAALYLREFTGAYRDRWAHIDMSAPAWSDGVNGELVKGATGWGVRTLLRWLTTLADGPG